MSFLPNLAFLTGSVGTGEWIVLFVVILIVVGPKRLPDVVRKIGRTMEMFRRAADEFKDQLMSMDQDSSSTSSAESPSTTDEDGVSQTSDSGDTSAEVPTETYPDVADYPGNEDQAAEAFQETPGDSPPDGAESSPSSSTPADVSTPDKPAEGGA